MANRTSDYVGLTKKGAQNKAEANNLIFRLIRVDGETFLSYPDDTRDDRVCVEIDSGLVSKVVFR